MKRPSKVVGLKALLAKAVRQELVRFTGHALERLSEREILALEVLHVLEHGYHEAKKDDFRQDLGAWTYAIRGKTIDDRRLRIAVAVVEPDVLVVTAIDLDRDE